MKSIPVADGVYWVGAVDWAVRHFHGFHYHTARGTTYNAYVVTADKTALVDTVHAPFTAEFLERLGSVVPPERLDYVVVNHIELDHAGALPAILERAPQATVVCTRAGEKGLRDHFGANWNFRTVRTGDEIDLGGRKLRFIEAPMLHWPDSMFTYVPDSEVLLSNDAFGQHLATGGRFDDETPLDVIMDEASKYYAGILTPYNAQVVRKLEELPALGVAPRIIAPSHGVIWRTHVSDIVAAYSRWATSPGEARVVIVFDTMYGATAGMARDIAEGVLSAGVGVRLFEVASSDHTEIIRDIVEARGLAVGCPTLNKRMLPSTAELLEGLLGLRPAGKIGLAFGAHGWGGGAVAAIEEVLTAAGVSLQESLKVRYRPTAEDRAACVEAGRRLAAAITQAGAETA